jgi:hypothetical protein
MLSFSKTRRTSSVASSTFPILNRKSQRLRLVEVHFVHPDGIGGWYAIACQFDPERH